MFDTVRKFGLVSGLGVMIAACGQTATDTPTEAVTAAESSGERVYFQSLLSEPFPAPAALATEPVDFAAAFASLPDGVSLETGAVSLVPETGATRVEDFAIVYDLEGEGVGLQADEVLFYGFDPDAIVQRIAGSNLDATAKVADRIELRGVKSVGMDAMSRFFMDGYIEALDELTPIDGSEVYNSDVLDALSYNFSLDALLIDGFTFEPFVYAKPDPVEAPEEEAELGELAEDEFDPALLFPANDMDAELRAGFQQIGAFARAFRFDAIVYENLQADYEMQMDGVSMSMDMTMPLAGLKGYNRGDLDYSGGWDATFIGSLPFPADPFDEAAMKSIPMTGGVALTEHSGVRLSRAMEALANWEMPASDEADFMDFGRMKMSDYTIDLDGKTLFKVAEFGLDTDFHWLLPTEFKFSLTDTGYNLANLFEVMADELAADMDGEFTTEDLQTLLAKTKEYGFDCFCGDISLNLTWDETSGDMTYREKSQFADAFSGSTAVDLGFSTPAKMAALFDFDDPEEAFEAAFKSDFAFRELKIELNDIGGLTNLFDMLHAIGQAFPDQEGMAMLTYNDAAQLRMLAVNGIIGMKPIVRQEFEPADPWMTALANFLEEGGSLRVAMSPPEPITVALVEAMEAADSDPEPEEIVEFLGLTVTHTK
ncbi:MAG: hypothetical protein AAGL11_10680 [Pseudomonadota bacterium]